MEENIYRLPVGDTLSAAWLKVKGAKGTMWAGLLIVFVAMFAFGMLESAVENMNFVVGNIILLIGQFILFFLQVGLLYLGIKRAQDMPITYDQMFMVFKSDLFFKIIGLYILQFLIYLPLILLGFLALNIYGLQLAGAMSFWLALVIYLCSVVGFIYLYCRLLISTGIVLDKKTNPWEAIKQSFRATRANVLRLVGISLILLIIFFISILPLGIGLIWSLPLLYIAYGMIYHRLFINIGR